MISVYGHETIEHIADMGIRGWGATKEDAFREVGLALAELMFDVEGIDAEDNIEVECSEPELEDLLVEFLNRFLCRMDIEELVCVGLDVESIELTGGSYNIKAKAGCIKRSGVKERLLHEVKAATYCGAKVEISDSGIWEAVCVVDM